MHLQVFKLLKYMTQIHARCHTKCASVEFCDTYTLTVLY